MKGRFVREPAAFSRRAQKQSYCKVSSNRYVGFFLGKKPVEHCGFTLHLLCFCFRRIQTALSTSYTIAFCESLHRRLVFL